MKKFLYLCLVKIFGGGRNFERPIFRNLTIANVKSDESSSYSIFLFTNSFSFFFQSELKVLINFPNLIFFDFLLNFVKLINFVNIVNL